jgi:hypothetical protein
MDQNIVKCDRCGLMVSKQLIKYHVCQGKNPDLRSVNIPLNVWATKPRLNQSVTSVPPIPKIAKDIIIKELRDQLDKSEKDNSFLKNKLNLTRNMRDYFVFGSFGLVVILVLTWTKHC